MEISKETQTNCPHKAIALGLGIPICLDCGKEFTKGETERILFRKTATELR